MGDMAEYFKDMNEEKKKRHQGWKEENTRILAEAGLPYLIKGDEVILFREPGKPKVDFYPSTGRWKSITRRQPSEMFVAGSDIIKYFSGGAEVFLKWYKKQ